MFQIPLNGWLGVSAVEDQRRRMRGIAWWKGTGAFAVSGKARFWRPRRGVGSYDCLILLNIETIMGSRRRHGKPL